MNVLRKPDNSIEDETIIQDNNNAKVNLKRGRNSIGSSYHSSFTISEDGLNASNTNGDKDDYRTFSHLYNHRYDNQDNDDDDDGDQQDPQQQRKEQQHLEEAPTQQFQQNHNNNIHHHHQQHKQPRKQQHIDKEKHQKKHQKSKSNPKLPKSKLRRRTSDQRVMARRGAMILGTNDKSQSISNVISDFSKLNPF